MKSPKKLLSLVLALSTLICCFANLYVKASGIDVSSYTYVVDNMTFYKGEQQIDSLSGATEVAVDVTRRAGGGNTDRLIVSTYSDKGEYIGMHSVTLHIDFGKTSTVKVLLNIPEEKTLGEVKAYVWKSFSSMTPLSNSLSSENNMIIEPQVKYDELQTEFTDVAINDSYADAASFMKFLSIMNGYEDGTFRPTLNLRVADAAILITHMTKGDDLASTLRNETLVADEIASSIERGYINYCVKSKWLVPDENGYVNYNENITIKDFLILTINALGYYPIQNTNGSWQSYLNIATLLNFENLDDYDYSDYVTRGTAAQILTHAVNVPIVLLETSEESVEYYVVQDGVGSPYYQTILTKYFDLYTVEGYVTATAKDNNMGLRSDEVNFGIAKSQKYIEEDLYFNKTVYDYDTITSSYDRILWVKVGETNAAEYIGLYATAYLKLNSEYDWEFMRFIPSNKNKIAEFNSGDLDKDDYNLTESRKYLKFFEAGNYRSTKYYLSDNVSVYVNGARVVHDDAILNFVLNGDSDKITLVDTFRTDGIYDKIFVNSYVTAMVDTVLSSGKITFKSDTIGVGTLTLDEEDDSVFFKIYLDGEEIAVQDLKENDILTIAYGIDPYLTNKESFKYSNFYEIYVSRNVINATYNGKNADSYKALFGDTYYSFVLPVYYTVFADSAPFGDDYTLYLDTLGRIYKAEIVLANPNYAIVNKFWKVISDDEYKLTMFSDDGEIKSYYFDSLKATVKFDGVVQTADTDETLNDVVGKKIYTSWSSGSSNGLVKSVENLVITYKVSMASGKITEINFISPSANTVDQESYNASNATLGSIIFGDETFTVDATKWTAESKDLSSIDYTTYLKDEALYEAYAYGDKINNNTIHPFVIIKSSTSVINQDARFAVITQDGYMVDTDEETGEPVYEINAMYGESEVLVASDEVDFVALSSLKKGDIIYFTTDSNEYINNFEKVFSFEDSIPSQEELASSSLVPNNTNYANLNGITIPTVFSNNFFADFTTEWTDVDADAIQIIYGPIIEMNSNSIAFGMIDSLGTTNIFELVEFGINSDNDLNVYTYNYSDSPKLRFGYSGSSISMLYPSSISLIESDGETIDWNKDVNRSSVTFAFAVVVGGKIVDILAFLPD